MVMQQPQDTLATSTASSTLDTLDNNLGDDELSQKILALPESGDVLVIDPQNEWSAVKNYKANSNQILGVVSTDPAGILRGDLERAGKEVRPVALTGTVPVKVSLENGDIKKGDLLTTASTPGYAMKAIDKNAGIIGIALENYTHTDVEQNISSTAVDLIEESLGQKELDKTNLYWYCSS